MRKLEIPGDEYLWLARTLNYIGIIFVQIKCYEF